MTGFIRKREVLANSILVIRLYGFNVYIHCLFARRDSTFLGMVVKYGKKR